MKTDIQIAQEATLQPIKEVAATIGIEEEDLELYGNTVDFLWNTYGKCHTDDRKNQKQNS